MSGGGGDGELEAYSLGGWSELGEPVQPAAPNEPTVDDGPAPAAEPAAWALAPVMGGRYRRGGELGRGGMGRVLAVHDEVLGRDVAWKEPARDDPHVRARLRHEVEVLAGLQHPGIVPVLDAGADERGLPYYTMPRIRGVTLAEAIERARDEDARLALLRPLHRVAETIAYVHARGVVHGDLKPGNLMLGEHGEAYVLDWGLARAVGRDADPEQTLPEPRAAEVARDADAAGSGSRPPAVAGTPRYLSPECLAGASATRASDVWALGAILHALLCGGPPDDRAVALRSLRAAAARSPFARGTLPPELAAVAARALAERPSQRYPDAQGFAEDLGRFLDGRPVGAYRYRRRDVVRALIRANARAVAATGAVVAVAFVAVIGAWVSALVERDRARAAEEAANTALDATARAGAREQRARAAADRALALAYVREAARFALLDDRARAEQAALAALAAGPSAEARGVLAQFGPRGRPSRVGAVDVPTCEARAIAPDGEHVACVEQERLVVRRTTDGDAVVRGGVRVGDAAFVAGGAAVWWLDVEHAALVEVDPAGNERARMPAGPARWIARGSDRGHGVLGSRDGLAAVTAAGVGPAADPCVGDAFPWLAAVDGEVVLAMCSDQSLVRVAWSEPGRALWQVPAREHPVQTLMIAPGQAAAFLGDAQGRVHEIDPISLNRRRTFETTVGRVQDLSFASRQGLLAVVGHSGVTSLLAWPSGAPLETIPDAPAGVARLIGDATLVAAAVKFQRWRLDPEMAPRAFAGHHGLSAADRSSDGRHIAVAAGDGTFTLYDAASGRVVIALKFADAVAKHVAFSPDGRQLALAGMQTPVRVLDVDTLTVHDLASASQAYRRVAWLDDRTLVGLAWTTSPEVWRDRIALPLARDVEHDWADISVAPEGGRALVLDKRSGEVWALEVQETPKLTRVGAVDGARAVEAAAAGVAIVATGKGLTVLGPGGRTELPVARAGNPIADVDTDAAGRFAALALRDGSIELVELGSGVRQLVAARHRDRAVDVRFGGVPGRAQQLLSASWDGSARVWDVGLVDAPAHELRAAVERAYGPAPAPASGPLASAPEGE